ncbi:hypothetical protein LEP1GSC050_1167 [Leptospira broomii serovar Hurstbridge str. 5399]|uniref:FlgN protein n=1 Tax=Leptospira broomii serovar Hurstbridge str. 5399 TaxID=1049789 RepID=T0GK86_9LEPT|nr:hypothetical protein [Leptospira broomii]EQA47184.1 hypothetical protein LEP1GSC050_1167 [Leptospira broomii serovar Hurstbridge str. 5399]
MPKQKETKQFDSREDSLSDLYGQKINLLNEVISLQKRQLEILGYGDGETAAIIEGQNSILVERMFSLDRKIELLEESAPQSLNMIQLADELFRKLEESRDLNGRVGSLMEQILSEYQKELNLVQANIQLKKFLAQRKSGWKTGTC